MTSNTFIGSARRRQRLLGFLADGKFHSGEALARRLRVSRSAVWKLVGALRETGVDIQSVPRQGYRLPRPVDLLDRKAIEAALDAAVASAVANIDVLMTVDSTNQFLVDALPAATGTAQLCTAEIQVAGRGRRGRSWVAPFGSGICMSLAWQFTELPPQFSALSLAVGVAIVRALERFGVAGAQLKWPNDVLWQQRKLGGILLEMRGEASGPARVVIGIGLNTRMPSQVRLQLAEQQAILIADLYEILREKTPTRNELIAAIASELVVLLRQFAIEGFTPMIDQWRNLDALTGAEVKVVSGNDSVFGIAEGVEEDGSLRLAIDGETRKFVSGEVSVRRGPRPQRAGA
jgi:BirA family biotin operon repressor/biotin-[acetyl-CoA-carboxylase] ligase